MTPYLRDLDAALRATGIRGARRRRIIDEFADHLSCDPAAQLGEPARIARQFADELGTSLARTAALRAFAALALAGAVLVARVLTIGPLRQMDGSTADMFGVLAAILAAQVALAAGTLGLLRAWRLRGADTIPAAEARLLIRRAGVGLLAGGLAAAAVPLRAAATPHGAHPSTWLSLAAVAVALAALLLALPRLISAYRVRPAVAGPAGDLLSDFGPVGCHLGSPRRFALLFAAALVAAITLAGVLADDPYDGALRGLVEGGACLAGFAALGRYLGLSR